MTAFSDIHRWYELGNYDQVSHITIELGHLDLVFPGKPGFHVRDTAGLHTLRSGPVVLATFSCHNGGEIENTVDQDRIRLRSNKEIAFHVAWQTDKGRTTARSRWG
jgi:hypothetical protein